MRIRRTRWPAAVAAAVMVAVLAATLLVWRGSGAASRPPDAPVDLGALTRGVPCPTADTNLTPVEDIASSHPVAAVYCTEDERRYDDGEWTVRLREASATGIDALVAAITRVPPPTPSDVSCAAVAYGRPAVAFVTADGRYATPDFRTDACGYPLGLNEIVGHDWQVLDTTKLTR